MRPSTDDVFVTTKVGVNTTTFARHETRDMIEAILIGDIEGVRRLLAAGLDPNMKTDWHRYSCVPPLALAMQQRQFDVARTLIEHGADAMFNFDDGLQCSTAMTSAIMYGGEEAVQILLDAGHPITQGMLTIALKGSTYRDWIGRPLTSPHAIPTQSP